MHRELPRLFRSRVKEVVDREMQPVEVSLIGNLERLIRESQYQLSSGYREAHMAQQRSEISTMQPTETLVNSGNATNTMEHPHIFAASKDQQASSEFFNAVLQPPPPHEDYYTLDFSASDAELLDVHKHTPSGDLSDSGYVSVPRCLCTGHCSCLTSVVGFGNRDFDVCEPSSIDRTQNLEAQNRDTSWQDWL